MVSVFYKTNDGGVLVPVMFRRGVGPDIEVVVDVAGYKESTVAPSVIDQFLSADRFFVAHRLGGGEFPEHTTAGLEASIAAGFKAFEFSTYRSSDGVYVGSHDWTTERTTGVRHEIWNTDWATLSQLQQQAGPLIRLQDAVAAMPADGILVLDHKTTSASASSNQGDLASESDLFNLLDELFDKPQERVIWKVFSNGASAERARAKGYKVMCMLYENELPTAKYDRWDVLGLEYNASKAAWDTINGTGKPTIAHIIYNQGQADTAWANGARGVMSSVPTVVRP